MRRTVVFASLLAIPAAAVAFRLAPPPPPPAPTVEAPVAIARAPAPTIEPAIGESVLQATDAPAAAPLRVAAQSHEVLAPGYADPSSIELSVLTPTDLPTALARAGGADIALLPLPDLVRNWDRIRALDPRIFAVVAWSDGRELVSQRSGDAPTKDVVVHHAGPISAAWPTLFVLDQRGVQIEDVVLVDDPTAWWSSVPSTDHSTVMTTADAPGLIPIVAVAASGTLTSRHADIEAWVNDWSQGSQLMLEDIPSTTQRMAAIEGAPTDAELLERLGGIRYAVGRPSEELDKLFVHTWDLARRTGSPTSPLPVSLPIDRSFGSETSGLSQDVRASNRVLSTIRLDDRADAAVEVGFLSQVYGRSALRLTVAAAGATPANGYCPTPGNKPWTCKGRPRSSASAKKLAAKLTTEQGVEAERIRPGTAHLGDVPVVVEILAPR